MGALTLLLMASLLLPAPGEGPADRSAARQAAAHLRSGQEHLAAGNPAAAVGDLQLAIAADPQLVLAHYNLGQAHMALQQYAEAEAAFAAAIAAVAEIGTLQHRRQSEIDRANEDMIRELRESIRFLRSPASKVADPERRITMLEERIRMLENMKLRPDSTITVPAAFHLALGSARFRLGNLEQAEQDYRRAVEADPGLGAAHSNLAVIYMLTERFDKAREAIARAEATGFTVSPAFKQDLEARAAAASSPPPQ